MVKKGRDSKHASKDDHMTIDGASDDSGSGTSRPDPKKLKSDDHSGALAAKGSDAPASAADIAALIATVNRRFDALSVGITTQGEKLGHLSGAFAALEGNLAKFQDKTNNDIANLETKLNEQNRAFSEQIKDIQKKLSEPNTINFPPAIASASAASGHASSSMRPSSLVASSPVAAAGDQRRDGRRADTDHSPSHIQDSHKILVLGLPRELPRPAHYRIVDEIRCMAPDGMLNDIKVLTGGRKVFAIAFPTAAAARRFSSWIQDHEYEWGDPRDGAMLKLNFVIPRSLAERARGRALKDAWKILDAQLASGHRNVTDDMKVVSDTVRGRLSIKTDEDIWNIFYLKAKDTQPDAYTLHFDPASLAYFGIDVKRATDIGGTADEDA
jgi:hypothetical protein